MKLEMLIDGLNKIKNGSYFSVQWKTDLSKHMRACLKSTVIEKRVATVCRKGVMPSHIKSVIESKIQRGEYQIDENGNMQLNMSQRSWAESVIPNLIIKSKSSGKHMAVLYTAPNTSKVQYYVNGKPIRADKLKSLNLMQPSYWKEAAEKPYVLTIPTASIEKIKQGKLELIRDTQ